MIIQFVMWSRGDIGVTHDLAQRGVGRSGRESVMAVGRFCRNAVGPPEWECEAMGSVGDIPRGVNRPEV